MLKLLRRPMWAMLFVVGASDVSQALAAESPAIAVFQIEDTRASKRRLSKRKRSQLTDYAAALLAKGGRFKLVPGDQLKAALQKKKSDSYRACVDQACQIEIGKTVAAQKSVSTKILNVGGMCVISAAMFDLRTEVADGVGSSKGRCDEKSVTVSLESAVAELKQTVAKVRDGTPAWFTAEPKMPGKVAITAKSWRSEEAALAVALNDVAERLNDVRAKEFLEHAKTGKLGKLERVEDLEPAVKVFVSREIGSNVKVTSLTKRDDTAKVVEVQAIKLTAEEGNRKREARLVVSRDAARRVIKEEFEVVRSEYSFEQMLAALQRSGIETKRASVKRREGVESFVMIVVTPQFFEKADGAQR